MAKTRKKLILQIVASFVSLVVIIVIQQVLYAQTFEWSRDTIQSVYKSQSAGLKNFVEVMKFFGTYWPNLITIAVWVSMFKRRQQALSYTILMSVQVFISCLFKLATHESRPYMIDSDDLEPKFFISTTKVQELGSPSDTALNTMCVGLSLAIEKVLWETELR